MIEKNSAPVLTPDDLAAYRNGVVSDRIREIWGLTFDELDAIIKAHTFKTQG